MGKINIYKHGNNNTLIKKLRKIKWFVKINWNSVNDNSKDICNYNFQYNRKILNEFSD